MNKSVNSSHTERGIDSLSFKLKGGDFHNLGSHLGEVFTRVLCLLEEVSPGCGEGVVVVNFKDLRILWTVVELLLAAACG